MSLISLYALVTLSTFVPPLDFEILAHSLIIPIGPTEQLLPQRTVNEEGASENAFADKTGIVHRVFPVFDLYAKVI